MHYEKHADGTVKCIEDEIPFEVPEGWEWTRVFSIADDLPYGTAKKSEKEGRIAVLRMGNIQAGEIDYDDLVFSSDEEDMERYLLSPGDLLFNRTNSAEWVGKTAIYRGDIPCIYAGYLIRLRTHINAEYLNAVMNSGYAKEYCALVKTDGVNQSNINAQKLGAFLVPVPSLKEQKRLASWISTALPNVETIQQCQAEISDLVTTAKAHILDLAIRGQLVPQNPDDEPAAVLLERIRTEKENLIHQGKIKRDKRESTIFRGDDNSYYERVGTDIVDITEELPFPIPETWCWARMTTLFEINSRNKLDDSLEVSFIPMPLIEDGYSGNHGSEKRKWSEVKTGFTHFAEGDIGIAKITPCFENRKSVVFQNLTNGFGAGTTELHVLRPYGKLILPEYALALVKTKAFIEDGKQEFTGAVGQQRIGKDFISEYLFPIPPYQEQIRIVNTIEQIFHIISVIEQSIG